MTHENFFKKLLKSMPDFRKTVLIIFLIQNDKDLLHEICFIERDINRLNLEFKNILIEDHEDYLENIMNEEESKIEKILHK